MSTIAELRRQDANIVQALSKADQEMRSYTVQLATLTDPRMADLNKMDQLRITCEAIQEYLIRHREKLTACLANHSVLEQAALPAGPDLSLANLSISAVGEEKPRFSFGNGSSNSLPPLHFSLTPATSTTTTTSTPALPAILNGGQSLASTPSVPTLQPTRFSLPSTGQRSSEQKPPLSLNPQPASTSYLTLSGKPPPKVFSLRSQSDVAK